VHHPDVAADLEAHPGLSQKCVRFLG
jgi:hypothetical protein